MNASDQDLLREFARDGSEAAFAELVRRYLDLVFSAALRQLDSDVHAASDVTQIVFTDLARKAGTLGRHTALTGWLYSSTRFEAIQHRRTEARRLARETAAHAMSEMLATASEPDWSHLQPVLDEAMHDLPEDDRLAVLLRYFEKRPLAEIGTRLGLSENTARMRVDRALDKLHTALKKRGITSTAAALGTLIGGNAIASVPAGLAEQVTRTAAGAWQRKRPALANNGPGWLIPVTIALLLGITGLMWMNRQGWFGSKTDDDARQLAASDPSSETDSGKSANGLTDSPITGHSITNGSATDPEPGPDHELLLKIITKDTGQPVPGVTIESDNRFGASAAGIGRRGFQDKKYGTVTSRAGEARVRYLPDVEQLEVSTAVDGFASMILRWHPQKGQPVPTTYILRLDRTRPIGGRVLDADGKPATNSTSVQVMAAADLNDTAVERYASVRNTKVDTDGRWRIHSLAEPFLSRVSVGVWSEGCPPAAVSAQDYPAIVNQLRDETHVIRLEKGLSLEGDVVNESGHLVPGALVTLSGGTYRHTRTSDAGTFRFPGLIAQNYFVGVAAPGYAPTNTDIAVTEKIAPVRISVGAGVPLKVRLMDGRGTPVTNAMVSRLTPLGSVGSRLGMAEEKHPDADGRLVWTNAAPGVNQIEIEAEGYIREDTVPVVADGAEHVVTLMRAPVIRGRVTDADSGRPVQGFNLALGGASRDDLNQTTNIDIGFGEWFRPYFTNGTYRYEVARRISSGSSDGAEFMVRFEAKGYRPQVSRTISYEESDVTLDVALEPAVEIDVTVVDPSGQPAASALLGLAKTGSRFFLKGFEFSFLSGGTPGVIRSSGGGGKLTLPQEPDVIRIVAVHPAGYAETTFAALAIDPVLRLQAWGRIKGQFASTNTSLEMPVKLAPKNCDPVVEYGFTATADASGRFLFPHVPPGDLIVWQRSDFGISDLRKKAAAIRSAEVTVEPGKSADVTLGGVYRVTGRLILPGNMPMPRFSYWKGTLGMSMPEIPPAFAGDRVATLRWIRQPDVQLQFLRAEQVPVISGADGTFIADAVNPGTYRLQMTLYSRARDGRPETRLQTVDHEVFVPEQPGTGEIDLGDVTATAVSR